VTKQKKEKSKVKEHNQSIKRERMQMAILLRGGALADSSFRLCSLPSTSSLHVSQNVVIPTSSSSSSPILPLVCLSGYSLQLKFNPSRNLRVILLISLFIEGLNFSYSFHLQVLDEIILM